MILVEREGHQAFMNAKLLVKLFKVLAGLEAIDFHLERLLVVFLFARFFLAFAFAYVLGLLLAVGWLRDNPPVATTGLKRRFDCRHVQL